jgi:hypothetical protein
MVTFIEAIQRKKICARNGDSDAQYWLAQVYLPSSGFNLVDKNPELALRYLKMAAASGNANALFNLSKLHAKRENGLVKYKPATSLDLLVRAAESGLRPALIVLLKLLRSEGPLLWLLTEQSSDRTGGLNSIDRNVVNIFIEKYRTHRAAAQCPVPEAGEGTDPATGRPISYERSDWYSGLESPRFPGVYEQEYLVKTIPRIFFSFWDGKAWLGRRAHPEDLLTEMSAGILEQSRHKCRRWRGLRNDAKKQYETNEEMPEELRADFPFGGYVIHQEFESKLVQKVHVAKSLQSPDSQYLTACGYRSSNGRTLELWSLAPKMMIKDGNKPELCVNCKSIAFTNRS